MGWGGFLKGLVKWAPAAAGIAAAPFTGGASLLPTLGKIGAAAAPVLGGMAQGRAEGKKAEADSALAESQIRNQALMQEFEASLKAKQQASNDALRGDAMSNMQDVKASWGGPGSGLRGGIVRFGGGKRPSLMSDATRNMGKGMAASGRGLVNEMGAVRAPTMVQPNMPKAGVMDKILGVAAPAMALSGALGGLGGGGRAPLGGGGPVAPNVLAGLPMPLPGGIANDPFVDPALFGKPRNPYAAN